MVHVVCWGWETGRGHSLGGVVPYLNSLVGKKGYHENVITSVALQRLFDVHGLPPAGFLSESRSPRPPQ